MRVEYTVTANSPVGAERAGAVYLSQLCDLLSVVTRSPVWFYMRDEDARDERIRMNRQAATIDRILTDSEWSWITGNLVFLRREHPRFLAAASWYRRGLIGKDSLDDFCCFWKVIERLAFSYADRSTWSDEEKSSAPVKKYLDQLIADLFKKRCGSRNTVGFDCGQAYQKATRRFVTRQHPNHLGSNWRSNRQLETVRRRSICSASKKFVSPN